MRGQSSYHRRCCYVNDMLKALIYLEVCILFIIFASKNLKVIIEQ